MKGTCMACGSENVEEDDYGMCPECGARDTIRSEGGY